MISLVLLLVGMWAMQTQQTPIAKLINLRDLPLPLPLPLSPEPSNPITNTNTTAAAAAAAPPPKPIPRVIELTPRRHGTTFSSDAFNALTLCAYAEVKSAILDNGEDARARTWKVEKAGLTLFAERVRMSDRPYTYGLLRDMVVLLREQFPLTPGAGWRIAEVDFRVLDLVGGGSGGEGGGGEGGRKVLAARGYVYRSYDAVGGGNETGGGVEAM